MSFQVVWTNSAESDLTETILYLAEKSPDTTRQKYDQIKTAAQSLNQFPDRGRIVPELMEYGITTYRELIIKPYRLIYKVSEQNVNVLLFIDSRRNIEDILLKRLLR